MEDFSSIDKMNIDELEIYIDSMKDDYNDNTIIFDLDTIMQFEYLAYAERRLHEKQEKQG